MKSKTLQPVDKGTKAGKKSATAEKAAKPSSLSLPTPTKMTPQQQQLNSDESSEMDFDALSNDASATASEGESVTATDGATEGPEIQLDMPFGSWVTSADMSTAKMTKGNILVCELRKQDSTYARAQVKVIQGTAYKNVDGAFVPE